MFLKKENNDSIYSYYFKRKLKKLQIDLLYNAKVILINEKQASLSNYRK